jgi:hypothetical protein
MAKTTAQQAIRIVARRVTSGEMSADDAAARVAAIHDRQAIAVYRARWTHSLVSVPSDFSLSHPFGAFP